MRMLSGLIAMSLSITTMMLLTGCSSQPASGEDEQAEAFADLRSAVTATATDDDRQNDVLAIIDSLERDVDDLRVLLVRRRAELRELNAYYNATREEFVEFSNQMEARIQSGRREAIQQHIKLADAMTEEEWGSLARAQTKAMRSIGKSLQGI